MKTILKLAALLVLTMAITTTLFANPEKDAEVATLETLQSQSIKEMIGKSLTYPSYAKAERLEGDVWIKVNVDPNGNLKVVESNSKYKLLENYTRDKIESLKVQEVEKSTDLYLQISFKLL